MVHRLLGRNKSWKVIRSVKDLGMVCSLFGCNRSSRLTWNRKYLGVVRRLFDRDQSLYVCVPMLEMIRPQGTWCAPRKFSHSGICIRGNLGSKMGLIRNRAKINFCELEFKNQ